MEAWGSDGILCSITALLQKFRIDFSDICVLTDLHVEPKLSTINEFNEVIAPFKTTAGEGRSPNIYITDTELEVMKERVRTLGRHASQLLPASVLDLPAPEDPRPAPAVFEGRLVDRGQHASTEERRRIGLLIRGLVGDVGERSVACAVDQRKSTACIDFLFVKGAGVEVQTCLYFQCAYMRFGL